MIRTAGSLLIAIVASFTVAAYSQQPASAPAVVRQELDRVPVEGLSGYEAVTMRTTFPAGAMGSRHVHTGQEFIYVLSGSIVIQSDGEEPLTVKAGEAHMTAPNRVHRVSNPSAAEPCVLVAISMVPRGQPASRTVE